MFLNLDQKKLQRLYLILNKEEVEGIRNNTMSMIKSHLSRQKYLNKEERTPTPISPKFNQESGEETRHQFSSQFRLNKKSNPLDTIEKINDTIKENSYNTEQNNKRVLSAPKPDELFQRTTIDLEKTKDKFNFNKVPSENDSSPEEDDGSKIEIFEAPTNIRINLRNHDEED